MTKRINAGYTIIRQLKIDETEIALGENLNNENSKYVTWIYYDDYYGVHYFNERYEAIADYCNKTYKKCMSVIQELKKKSNGENLW